jgi:hypothetical protein
MGAVVAYGEKQLCFRVVKIKRLAPFGGNAVNRYGLCHPFGGGYILCPGCHAARSYYYE